MDHLDYPTEDTWNNRRDWFQALVLENGYQATSKLTGEQATALLFEVQCCFCAGAWAAVVILAVAVIESNIGEIMPAAASTQGLKEKQAKAGFLSEPLDDLRKRRNSLVHFPRRGIPAITVDDQYDNRDELEVEACRAIELMFQLFEKKEGA